MTNSNDVIAILIQSVPEAEWITDPGLLRVYECDAYTAYREMPLAVVLPSKTSQIADIMRIAKAKKIPVVARGAGTSLVGGAMPLKGGIVLALTKMDQVLAFEPNDRMITVQSGMTNLSVSDFVDMYGLFYAPDPSSQMACTIGGNVAMNSGGAHCLKYGVTTNNLVSVTIVTHDGEILTFHQDDGLDLRGLICGSEGQLGIITEACLKLETKAAGSLPMLIGFDDPHEAGACVADIIKAGILPVAIEYMDKTMIEQVEKFANAGYPDVSALLIVEFEGRESFIQRQTSIVEEIAQRHHAKEIRSARDGEQAVKIWAGRKAAFGVMGRIADYITLDGCVPISQLAYALQEIEEISKSHCMGVTNVFHAGDGNLHPLIMYDAQKEGDLERAEAMGAEILKKCVELGGCLTGEHGVGVEKRELMGAQWNTIELERMMQIKDAFDPNWQLNPEKVFPLTISESRRQNC